MAEEHWAHKHRTKLIIRCIHCFHRLHTTCGLQFSHAWLKFGFDVHRYPYLTYWHTHCLSALLPYPLIIRIKSLWLLIQITSSKTKALIKCSDCMLFYHAPITTWAVLPMASEADLFPPARKEHKVCRQHGHSQAAQEHKRFCCQKNLWHTCWQDCTKHVKNSTTEKNEPLLWAVTRLHQITWLWQDIKRKIWDTNHFGVNTIKQHKYNSTGRVFVSVLVTRVG